MAEPRTSANAGAPREPGEDREHGFSPMPMCPMAETCKGMMDKPSSGMFLIIPGLLFVAVGVLIVLVPQLLVWLIALASILFGFALLFLAKFMRTVGSRLRGAER